MEKLTLGGPRLETPTPTPEETPPATPSAFVRSRTIYKTPRRIKLAIAGTALMIGLVAFAFSVRAWRTWNLFDRQYRFPRVDQVPLRLGANKSGGCMATIAFGDGVQLTPEDP